jgi:UDP-glucose 4-epimerase
VGVAALNERFLLVGGAGFIGSHLTDSLLADANVAGVTVYDNFSSGREWHLDHSRTDPGLTVVRGDVKELGSLEAAMRGHEVVVHLASNPDIARAATEPAIDFDEGTYLTHHVVEAARRTGVQHVLFASGSGVYGDLGELEVHEDHGPLIPVSTYGAGKLAGEGLIAAYAFMFDVRGSVFRFGNVVGPRQTHGVGFDFVRSLVAHPSKLRILGNGRQSKSYVHVSDVVAAVLLAYRRQEKPYEAYNVASGDYITVTEIADLAAEVLGLDAAEIEYEYTGGARGWKGDVPIVRLNTERIRGLGWSNRYSSREALRDSLAALADEARMRE